MNTQNIFEEYKQEVEDICYPVIKDYLNEKKYTTDGAEKWAKDISDKIIAELKDKKQKIKFLCTTVILPKGTCAFHFGSAQLWRTSADGYFVLKDDHDTFQCRVYLFAIGD